MREGSEFDAFYAATAPRLIRHIYLSTGDLGRAQDCVQDAYLRAWSRWGSIGNGTTDPIAWVRTVAWRLAINDWRRALRVANALVRRGADTDHAAPSADVIAVRDSLRTLPKAQATVIVLYYFEDLPVRAIAELLGVPEGTVKARLSRARAALATHFDTDEEAGAWAKT